MTWLESIDAWIFDYEGETARVCALHNTKSDPKWVSLSSLMRKGRI